MHDCRDMEQLLAAYADGELNKAEAERVEQHMANCQHCAALLDDYLALNEALASCAVKAPEGFADRVMDAVEKEKTATPKVVGRGVRLGRIAPFVGVAAAAVICISVVSTSLVRFVIKNLDGFEAVEPEDSVTDLAPETDANNSTGGALGTQEASTIQPETAYEEVVTEAVPPAEDEPTENEPTENEPEPTVTEETAWEGIETEEETARDESVEDGIEDSAEQTTTVAAGMTGEAIQTVPETAAPTPETENAPQYTETDTPETERDRVTAEAPTDAPVEVPTSAPTEDGKSTQATAESVAPDNAASAGLLARIWEAVVEFFESLFQGIARLFGGDT